MPKIAIDELKKDLEVKHSFGGESFSFSTTWGLFSPEKIDEGSILLINSLLQEKADSILDIGCGCGVIGIVLGKLLKAKEVHLIDKDFVAVEYSKKNAHKNNLENVQVYLSNGFSNVPEGKQFDLIVSNLPAKVSKEFFWILFEEVRQHLKIGGKFVVVTIAGLEYFTKKNFEKVFGNYNLVSSSRSYFVAEAIKTE